MSACPVFYVFHCTAAERKMRLSSVRICRQWIIIMNRENAFSKTGVSVLASGFFFIAVLVILDQLTKLLAVKKLSNGRTFTILPGVLELTFVKNRGAAFGILQDARVFFFLITAAALVSIGYVLVRVPASLHFRPLRVCLYFVASGAVGNLIDRIALSYVRDFIYFSLIDFPVFNVADIYITCSAFALILLTIFYYREEDDFAFLNRKSR